MPYNKKIRRIINLRNARIIVGNKQMEKNADEAVKYAKYVKITTITNGKIISR